MSWLNKLYPHEPMPIFHTQGNLQARLNFVLMLGYTKPAVTDPLWWEVRVMILFDTNNWRN